MCGGGNPAKVSGQDFQSETSEKSKEESFSRVCVVEVSTPARRSFIMKLPWLIVDFESDGATICDPREGEGSTICIRTKHAHSLPGISWASLSEVINVCLSRH